MCLHLYLFPVPFLGLFSFHLFCPILMYQERSHPTVLAKGCVRFRERELMKNFYNYSDSETNLNIKVSQVYSKVDRVAHAHKWSAWENCSKFRASQYHTEHPSKSRLQSKTSFQKHQEEGKRTVRVGRVERRRGVVSRHALKSVQLYTTKPHFNNIVYKMEGMPS